MKQIFVILAFTITMLCLPQLVHSVVNASENMVEVVQVAIQELAPRVSDERAEELAEYITEHAEESEIDPLLVTAIIMRESSFSYAMQTGKRVGPPPQNCVGLMQIYPYGAAHKLGGFLDLTDADVNIRTGVMWLEYVGSVCGDTHWQWVAAYGRSECPDYHTARRDDAAITARRLYCQIRSDCQEFWPRWEKRDGRGRLWIPPRSKLTNIDSRG